MFGGWRKQGRKCENGALYESAADAKAVGRIFNGSRKVCGWPILHSPTLGCKPLWSSQTLLKRGSLSSRQAPSPAGTRTLASPVPIMKNPLPGVTHSGNGVGDKAETEQGGSARLGGEGAQHVVEFAAGA